MNKKDLEKVISDNICVYDKRSAYYKDLMLLGETSKDIADMKDETCYCDNCFYGRDELAHIILDLSEKVK